MPITLSHPAAAVPLKRFGLVLSALIVGSMLPDFEFFLKLSSSKQIGHTIPGLFLFCLPVGLGILFIFHKLIKFPLLSLLPRAHQARLYPVARSFRFFPLSRFFRVVVSLLVGTITHIAWDSFTHYDGLMVELVPFLFQPLFTIPQGTVRIYFALQYVGSAVGAVLLLWWYIRWFKTAQPCSQIELHRFSLSRKVGVIGGMGVFAGGGGISYGYFSIPHFENIEMVKRFITYSSIATVSGVLIALVTFGVLWHFFIPHHERVRQVIPTASNS